MTTYHDIVYDNFLNITDEMDDTTLLNYCRSSRAAIKFCDENFWLHRIHSQGLAPLLFLRDLYPSLKSFYFNIRHDAIYGVDYPYIGADGDAHTYEHYYTRVSDAYNDVVTKYKTFPEANKQLLVEERYNPYYHVVITIINPKYEQKRYIIYTNDQRAIALAIDNNIKIPTVTELLAHPNLAPRSFVLIYDHRANLEHKVM